MVKKVLALAFGLVLSFGAMAQWEQLFNPTVPQSDIQFWTGTGSNRAVVAITWQNGTAGTLGIAWGVQWDGDAVLIHDIMDTIATYDSRMTITWNNSHNYILNLAYNDGDLNLAGEIDPDWGMAMFMYGWKAADETVKQSGGIMGDTIVNGDFVDWTLADENFMAILADTMIMATDPNAEPTPEDATIAASDILYWVGNGNNKVIFAVNWADTALAWGYKFSTDSVTVETMMNDIQSADPRFSWVPNTWGLDDINYVVAEGDTLGAVMAGWWMSTLNGNSNASAGIATKLGNNDFFKWGDYTVGVTVDTVTYAMVFPMTIYPVSQPLGIAGVESISMSVYPNPASSFVTISGFEGNNEAVLYDMRGSKVASYRVNGVEARLDLSAVVSGVYMLRVGNAVTKVIVK